MTAHAHAPRMTPEVFLAWENEQPERHEFVNGEIYAMTGATAAHDEITGNLYSALKSRLVPRGCRVYKQNRKVAASVDFFYPDVVVTCSEADRRAERVISEPRVVAEVLSPSTAAHDWGAKFEAYSHLPGLAEYVLVEAERIAVHVLRPNAAQRWERWHCGAGDSLELTSLGLDIPLAELYAGTAPAGG